MNISNFGRKSLNEVKERLAQLGLSSKKGQKGNPASGRGRRRSIGTGSTKKSRNWRQNRIVVQRTVRKGIKKMRHRVAGRKFGLPSDQRRASPRRGSRKGSFVKYGAIRDHRDSREGLRSVVEKVITTAKTNDIHSRRQARRWLNDGEHGQGSLRRRRAEVCNPTGRIYQNDQDRLPQGRRRSHGKTGVDSGLRLETCRS